MRTHRERMEKPRVVHHPVARPIAKKKKRPPPACSTCHRPIKDNDHEPCRRPIRRFVVLDPVPPLVKEEEERV